MNDMEDILYNLIKNSNLSDMEKQDIAQWLDQLQKENEQLNSDLGYAEKENEELKEYLKNLIDMCKEIYMDEKTVLSEEAITRMEQYNIVEGEANTKQQER